MNICIPLASPAGLDSPLAAHFAAADHWLVVDMQTHASRVIALAEDDSALLVDAVLCRAINRRSLRQLQARGVAVFGTQAESVPEALAGFGRGERLEPLIACAGEHGAHHHDEHHGGCGCHGEGKGGCHSAQEGHGRAGGDCHSGQGCCHGRN